MSTFNGMKTAIEWVKPPRPAIRVVFVGQGPNQTAWQRALAVGTKLVAYRVPGTRSAEERAVDYCARVAITGAIGKKIGAMLDMSGGEIFRSRYARKNLNARWNGKNGKGDVFNRAEGSTNARRLMSDPFTHYVLLGGEVARAFGMNNNEWLSVVTDLPGDRHFLIFPHPSGINRWWNEPGNAERARAAIRNFLEIK
jgi:hypothetical protein